MRQVKILTTILILFGLSKSYGMQEQSEAKKSSGAKSVKQKESKKSYLKRIRLTALLKTNLSAEQYIDQDDSSTSGSQLLVGAGLPVYENFYFGAYYNFGSEDDSSSETNRDEDIKDASGKDIRLVERRITHELKQDPSLLFQLEYSQPLSARMMFTGFVGYSSSKGELISERFDMTDRDKPILFSKHNRYYLTSQSAIKTNEIALGGRLEFLTINRASLFILAQYRFAQTTFSAANRNIRTRGEAISFNDSDFYFEKANNRKVNDNTVSLGIGLYF
jgi:hypothetical protein